MRNPYLCRGPCQALGFSFVWSGGFAPGDLDAFSVGGGALAPAGWPLGRSAGRLRGAVLALESGRCARAPSLISVHGPGWLRVGDMMVDGVPRFGEALR